MCIQEHMNACYWDIQKVQRHDIPHKMLWLSVANLDHRVTK